MKDTPHIAPAGLLGQRMLADMLQLQADMNALVNPGWLTAGYPFLRGAMMEGAEAIEHAGWKWWKAQTRNLEQLRMELVDIWHFALSDALVSAEGSADAAALWLTADLENDCVYLDGFDYCPAGMDTVSKLELLTALAALRRFNTALFQALLVDCGMTWTTLYTDYVGKNVLNRFRQDHGYKTGEYLKVWGGREDNEHLVEILPTLSTTDPGFKDALYCALRDRYLDLLP